MNIHSFQHTPSEGLGEIASWAVRNGHSIATTHWYLGAEAPKLDEVDWLVILGGPMNVYEHRNHPWLLPEKVFIRQAIQAGKRVLGVCLGSQLIADVLGGKVFQNPEIEIGWSPVRINTSVASGTPFAGFPEELIPLHWHGDTFTLPEGAVNIARSEACLNQAFAIGKRVVGVQFHLEVGTQDVEEFVKAEPGETDSLGNGKHIQTRSGILEATPKYIPAANEALFRLLDAMVAS